MEGSALYACFRRSSGVSTDTRTLRAGELFFALRGPNFDGNRYVEKAFAAGASAVVADDPELPPRENLWIVPDALQALQALARHHRDQQEIPFIALTGSNGKTTSKELLTAVLSSRYRVHATRGNLNNHIGVPLTLLSMPPNTEIALIEMGANHVGDIAELCQIAAPTHGAITNIGKAHIEGFGGQAGVLQGKTELYQFLQQQGGQIFAPAYDPLLAQVLPQYPEAILWGKPNTFFSVEALQTEPQIIYRDPEGNTTTTQLFGQHNLHNIQLALAFGRWWDVPAADANAAIAAYAPQNNRSQVIQEQGYTYILDAYNANPSSMEAGLRSFAQMPATHRVAILGDMLELGEITDQEHRRVRTLAYSLGLDQVIFCGPNFARIATEEDQVWTDALQLRGFLQRHPLPARAHVYLKGSRKVQLEQIIWKI
ncbi:MAG: UDP-N-acetylmuramoyl-tripeptide--D-alanyl-D-alanine ligase [Bernardetiaceae bacterium]